MSFWVWIFSDMNPLYLFVILYWYYLQCFFFLFMFENFLVITFSDLLIFFPCFSTSVYSLNFFLFIWFISVKNTGVDLYSVSHWIDIYLGDFLPFPFLCIFRLVYFLFSCDCSSYMNVRENTLHHSILFSGELCLYISFLYWTSEYQEFCFCVIQNLGISSLIHIQTTT